VRSLSPPVVRGFYSVLVSVIQVYYYYTNQTDTWSIKLLVGHLVYSITPILIGGIGRLCHAFRDYPSNSHHSLKFATSLLLGYGLMNSVIQCICTLSHTMVNQRCLTNSSGTSFIYGTLCILFTRITGACW
jgi:hypothetical protein